MNNIGISIVIPTRNAQQYIDTLLKAIFSQEIYAAFEVIIIDTASTDKTLDIISRYPVKYYQIDELEFNHGLTRNSGISKAQGKYIILMTQDAIPYDKYWMVKLVGNFKDDELVAGAYSKQVPRNDSCIITKARLNRCLSLYKHRKESRIADIEVYNKLSPQEKHYFCNFDNVSSCIRKSVWEKIPFPETDFAEDLEWSTKVLKSGYKIIYEPESIVYHSHNYSIAGWYRRNRIAYTKLNSIFGVNNINNLYRLFIFIVIYTFLDYRYLCKYRNKMKDILLNLGLAPLFAMAEAIGQYRGIKDSKRIFNENTTSSSRPAAL